MTTPNELFPAAEVASESPRLLDAYRVRVENASVAASKSLALIFDTFGDSMLHDQCVCAIESLEFVGVAAGDVLRNVQQAVRQQDGFDTWSRKELDQFIADGTRVADALSSLHTAVMELRDEERRQYAKATANLP